MTRFNLNAGRPASPYQGGGPPPFKEDAAEVDSVERNPYRDTHLKCGDTMPWGAIEMLGTPMRVMCEIHPDHGWQDVVTIPEHQRILAERKRQQCPPSVTPETLPF